MFATLNNGELDFILKSNYDSKIYVIEVKAGKNVGKTINKALELNKTDFVINLKEILKVALMKLRESTQYLYSFFQDLSLI